MNALPFGTDFDDTGEFLSAGQEEVLARAAYAIEQRHPIGLITGRPGTGKTFLLKQLCRHVRASGRVAILIDSPSDDCELRYELAIQIGLPTWGRGSAEPTWQQIREQLQGIQLTGRQVVLLIDLASGDVLQTSLPRLLRWTRGEFAGTMTIVLASDASRQADITSAERFALCRMELPLWTESESTEFIRRRLMANENKTIQFTNPAIRTIADFSQGSPRDLLRLGELTWNIAKADRLETVDSDIVIAAVREWSARTGENSQFSTAEKPSSERSRSEMIRAATEFAIH